MPLLHIVDILSHRTQCSNQGHPGDRVSHVGVADLHLYQSGLPGPVVATLSENLLQMQNLHFNKIPGYFICIVQSELYYVLKKQAPGRFPCNQLAEWQLRPTARRPVCDCLMVPSVTPLPVSHRPCVIA